MVANREQLGLETLGVDDATERLKGFYPDDPDLVRNTHYSKSLHPSGAWVFSHNIDNKGLVVGRRDEVQRIFDDMNQAGWNVFQDNIHGDSEGYFTFFYQYGSPKEEER